MATYTPAEVFPPGEYLRDELDERGWTVTEFAEILSRPVQAMSEILNGKKEITVETAISFGEALGTSPEFWLNLQTKYRLFEQRSNPTATERVRDVARRAHLRQMAPLSKMRARGWVPDTDDLNALETSVADLLELRSLDERPAFAMAARRANTSEPLSLEQIAWLGHIRRVARSSPVTSFDRRALEELAGVLPGMLRVGPEALIDLPKRFAEIGVALVFSEGLPGGKLDGAVTFLSDGIPVIGLTTRGDRFDSLVFTLLHECAHLVRRHITANTGVIVDDDVSEEQVDPIEREANDQASAWLFPDGFAPTAMTVPAIVAAAERYRVHPSIVLGRLQRDTGDWKRHRARIPKIRLHLDQAGLLS